MDGETPIQNASGTVFQRRQRYDRITKTHLDLLITLNCCCDSMLFSKYLVKLILCSDIVNNTLFGYSVVFLITHYFKLIIYCNKL